MALGNIIMALIAQSKRAEEQEQQFQLQKQLAKYGVDLEINKRKALVGTLGDEEQARTFGSRGIGSKEASTYNPLNLEQEMGTLRIKNLLNELQRST